MFELLERPMATPKKKPKAKAEDTSNRKALVIQVRASDEWKEWVEFVAATDGRSLAALVDRALIVYAKHIGIEREAPKR